MQDYEIYDCLSSKARRAIGLNKEQTIVWSEDCSGIPDTIRSWKLNTKQIDGLKSKRMRRVKLTRHGWICDCSYHNSWHNHILVKMCWHIEFVMWMYMCECLTWKGWVAVNVDGKNHMIQEAEIDEGWKLQYAHVDVKEFAKKVYYVTTRKVT